MIKPQFDLEGKRALITGATGGIGEATARLFARAGAELFVSGTREQKLRSLCAELQELGAACSYLAIDVNERSAPQRLVEAAAAKMGRLDVLVNALGINRPQLPEEVTEENWDAVLDTNLRSVFFICQAAGRQMISQHYGRIVNVSSQAGSVALPLRAAYCASKAGLNLMTRVLALEWAHHNIRVNAVSPTFVETPFVTEMFKDEAFKRYVLDSIPAGRMASADEVAHAALYLACDIAGIVTGHILLVDGGWTAK